MSARYMKIITRVIIILLLAAGLMFGVIHLRNQDNQVYRGTFVFENIKNREAV